MARIYAQPEIMVATSDPGGHAYLKRAAVVLFNNTLYYPGMELRPNFGSDFAIRTIVAVGTENDQPSAIFGNRCWGRLRDYTVHSR